uniref:Pyrroline-5-carboxylate reductase n=1 Tax=Coccolithus braarudii TaxID=221442 RepID=A0A7S0LEH8_9EUKA
MMAGAMMKGLVKTGTCAAEHIAASDAYQPCVDALAKELGVRGVSSNMEVAGFADLLIIAVKPQMVQQVCGDIVKSSAGKSSKPIVVSIAAGVTLSSLSGWLDSSYRVVRVMPNTPCLVGELAAAYASNSACSDADSAIVGSMLGALGSSFKVKESDLDAVTGLSGSGPAYVFQFIEALSDGGVRAGLTRPVATELAAKTGDESGRHDHRRSARARGGRHAGRRHERGGRGDGALQGAWPLEDVRLDLAAARLGRD